MLRLHICRRSGTFFTKSKVNKVSVPRTLQFPLSLHVLVQLKFGSVVSKNAIPLAVCPLVVLLLG